MFQFTRFASHTLCIQVWIPQKWWVSPFGNLRIKACLPAPRSLSQATTSFIACNRQGIHDMHLFTWPYNAGDESPCFVQCDSNKTLARYRTIYNNADEYYSCAYLRVMWFKQSQLLVKLLLITIISHEDQIVKERAADYYLLRNLLLPVSGGGERDRTDDPLLAKQVLSQLS